MKRKVLFVLLALGVSALVSAQGRDRRNMGPGSFPPFPPNAQQPAAENVTVTGNLTIAQGSIAVKVNGITYYTAGLRRYVGFIDGLKEGAGVTLEGAAMANPQDDKSKFLRVSKLTISGKTFDLAPPEGAPGPHPGMGPHPGGMMW